jgi:hypothetical protein
VAFRPRGLGASGGLLKSFETSEALYAADELAAVAQLLGAAAFPGVDGPGDSAGREASLRSARRSLLARGVIELDDDGILSIAPPHALMFGVALAPAATVVAQREGPEAEGRAWYLHPNLAVEHTVLVGAIHGLEQIDVAEVVSRLLDFLAIGLRRRGADPETFTAKRAALDRIAASLNAGSTGSLGAELPPEAASFIEALEGSAGAYQVRALHKEGSMIVGGELAWLDTGEAGLWQIEPVQGDPDQITIRRVGSEEIVGELLSYLPGGEPQPAT